MTDQLKDTKTKQDRFREELKKLFSLLSARIKDQNTPEKTIVEESNKSTLCQQVIEEVLNSLAVDIQEILQEHNLTVTPINESDNSIDMLRQAYLGAMQFSSPTEFQEQLTEAFEGMPDSRPQAQIKPSLRVIDSSTIPQVSKALVALFQRYNILAK